MPPHRPRHAQRFKTRSIYLWHRYLGISSAILVVILAVTGLLLNHTEDLRLDSRFVSNSALLNWYGIHPAAVDSIQAGNHWISLADGQLYLGEQPVPVTGRILRGALATDACLLALIDADLVLLTTSGALIERLDANSGMPAEAGRLGITDDGRIVLQTAHGNYLSDVDLTGWQAAENTPVTHWSAGSRAPKTLQDRIGDHARARTLPWERVMLDLHSGRLFGSWGVLLMDAAAILMLLLAISGSWLWWNQRRKQRQHHKPR